MKKYIIKIVRWNVLGNKTKKAAITERRNSYLMLDGKSIIYERRSKYILINIIEHLEFQF